jgi:hypothetical protein
MNALPVRPRPSSPKRRQLLGWCLGLGAAPLAAQTPVYETRDKDGPVFSDRPSPGSTPVPVGRTNVIASPPAPAASDPTTGRDSAPPPYRTLRIATPANRGTVHSNTGAFEVVVQASPGLRAAAGDRIRLVLDGQMLPQPQPSNRIQLTPADWQAAAAAETNQHTLQAAVIDAEGRVLITSAPVVFYVQRAAVGGRRR